MQQRVPTGIAGLDNLLGGGIPEKSIVLVTGTAGAGKTIFGMQFLVKGARNGERGLYITFDESRGKLESQASNFRWDFRDFEEMDLIKVLEIDLGSVDITQAIKEIENTINDYKPARLVLDSISTYGVYAEVIGMSEATADAIGMRGLKFAPSEDAVMRRTVMEIFRRLRKSDASIIVISELPQNTQWLSRDTVSEFACDGVIKLQKIEALGKRTLTIEKMRGTKHDFLPKTIEITEEGIVVGE
ncbi:MAG: ATPase domain-containing protein [Candidatus Micrarchaeia archaeon]